MIKKVIKKTSTIITSTIILLLALVLSNITVTNVYASDYDQLYLEEARRKVQDAVNIYMVVSNATTEAAVKKAVDDELQKQSGLMEATFTGEWKNELVFTPAEMFKPGLIKGVLTITLNNDSSKTIDAKINRSIESLPMTDEYKVGNVKARVDGYFKSFIGKNTDTKDSIMSSIKADSSLLVYSATASWKAGSPTITPATKEKAGSIIGTIVLTCGSATAEVSVDKVIDKLPKTDKEKIDEAKPLAETAITAITATNDTTAGNIIDAVTTGISSVDGVTSSWKTAPTITPATKDDVGSITGTIVLTCGNETVEVTVNKVIAQLPLTDKDKIDQAKPLAVTAITTITATNDTTAGNILDAVTTGISSVNGVTGSWKSAPAITPATKDDAGSITGTIVLTCGSESVEIVVNKTIDKLPTPTPETPTIIVDNGGSNHQINSDKNMTFTCSANLEDLVGVYVDGKLVDESNYTLKSGSTILTLKASYLDTLSAGKHTLKFQYNDDLSAETEFTITEKAGETPPAPSATTTSPAKGNTTTPKTGDDSNVALFTGAFAVAGIAIAVLAMRKKKIIE